MINAQVDDLSSYNTKYTSPTLTNKVFTNIKRIGKGFSGVETPLFDAILVQQPVQDVAELNAEDEDEDDNEVSTALTLPSPTPATTPRPPQQEPIPSPPQAESEQDKIAQALEITKLKQRVRKLEKKRRTRHSGLKILRKERMAESQAKVYNLDLQHSEKILNMQDTDEAKPAEVKEVLEVVTATKLMTEVVTTAAPITTAAQVPKTSAPRKRSGVVIQDPEEIVAASVIVHIEVKSKDKGKSILIEEPKPLKRKAQIKQDEAFARQLEAELNANIN
nr:hypothetical protein [Tanacetum cinerariifolium]